MNLFRNVLFWIVLALVGALVAQLLIADPGSVLVRYHGWRFERSLAFTVVLLLAVWLGLWLLWKLLSAPFVAFRRHRQRQAQTRLSDGLDALQQGHWSRAEKSLTQAATNASHTSAARVAAANAAFARGDTTAAGQHLEAIDNATARALAAAELALREDRHADALALLDAPDAQPLPPRGLALRAEALAALGRAGEAYGLLGALRQQQALSPARLNTLETQWAEASLREAFDANVLADRWEALPKPLKSEPTTVAAYAERAAALRWDEAAAKSLEQALDTSWDETLAALYGRLAIGRLDTRMGNAQRWLQTHPSSPALLLTLARLSRAQNQWPQAEAYLHRALAQGAGSEAWEELGHGFADSGDDARARLSYLNALRATRGEDVTELPGRDLRQKIFDQAAVEERDAHGVPRLRG